MNIDEALKSINDFNMEQTEENFISVLKELNGSTVLVPMKDKATLQPDILVNPGGMQAFPVFLSEAEMPEDYGKNKNLQEMTMTAVTEMAQCMGTNGVLVDPFSSQFYLDKQYYDALEAAK